MNDTVCFETSAENVKVPSTMGTPVSMAKRMRLLEVEELLQKNGAVEF